MWRGEAGKAFTLSHLIEQKSDFITPLNGLAGFENSARYSQTIFRLPLRTKISSLSENIYNIQKLQELLDALRKEAKYLLLFLKSVCKIQVVHISPSGQHSTSFCVEIDPANLVSITSKRCLFMQQLRQAHSLRPYSICQVFSFTATFTVIVTDNNQRSNQAGKSNWLIANNVGSADSAVQAAAAKQRTFPWVGTVLELGASSVGGRIFCFLPMPVEAASGLPVHVNGTFGLNDERRSLKWPGIERRNDPTANWNKILVSQLLPPCYAMLLMEAKKYISHDQFYRAWPDLDTVKQHFSEILHPLYISLFQQAVVWAEKIEALQVLGNWILISQATFISEDSRLPSIVKRVLTNSGVYLVEVPSNIWRAMYHAKVGATEVSPMLVRSKLRTHPESYSNIDPIGKRVILTYCLSDNCYNDLKGLNLLPLANGSFTNFDTTFGQQTVYLCSNDCPRSLLPNLNHLLVDASDDINLQQNLYSVAAQQQTKLRLLTERDVASLLSKALPSSRSSLVPMPHPQIPSTWLQTFWNWMQNKNLQYFANQLLIPCYISTSSSTRSFCLAPLSSVQAVIYVSRFSSCSSTLLSAFYKMNIRICLQSEFSYIQHRQLSSCIKQLDTNNVLDVIASQPNYGGIAFTPQEADSLRVFLISSTYTPSTMRINVLKNICIFSSASNSSENLFSVNTTKLKSITRQVIGEPNNCAFNVANLPSNFIVLSRANHYQLQLLQSLGIPFPSDFRLLVDHVFPLIRTFPDHLIDKLMPEVLDVFQQLNSREYNMASYLQSLQFVKTVNGRKSPLELFTTINSDILNLYSGEDVFPQAPYDNNERVQTLQTCGLRVAVTPQQVLDIVYSICCSHSTRPQQVDSVKLSRAKAVLSYISTSTFQQQTGGHYVVANDRYRNYTFSTALKYLATNWSWLPILSNKPSSYPEKMSWKGQGLSSHFISLSNSIVAPLEQSTLPYLVGSQAYIVSPTVAHYIADMLSTDSGSLSQYVVAHYKEILTLKDQLSADVMNWLVLQVYGYMNSQGASCRASLYSIPEWIYIKKDRKFVAPVVVALKQNSTFKRDLEPYIYVLPDTLSEFSILFGSASRIAKTVSQAQILSILKMIRDNVQANDHQINAIESWSTVMSILNWLTNNGNQNVPGEVGSEDVLVPVETQSAWPHLFQASEVVYTDNDFLKDYLQSSEEENSNQFVHDHISASLAHNLGAVPLSESLDISEDTFEDAGQHEPLTTRLKNILRDYKDGLTIIKELLQNADDAEATEVNICYDARQHETNPKKLFFSGIAEAHGPALIVHNNRTFSDDDFKNITKLAAATKQDKALKIGKFGIGFCSVYHMTDVPSFISRDYLYIFDPTLSYLKKEVKNPAQPGKKTKFAHRLISGSKQLDPYIGLFGFERTHSYQGTLFRLPFRTNASVLSGTCYTENTFTDLVSAIKECSSSLLLFLQHVRTITFQRIDPGQNAPVALLKICRESIHSPISLPTGVEIRSLSCTGDAQDKSKNCHWLISQANKGDRQKMYYTATVACPLGTSGSYSLNESFPGEIFCFLPLSQKSGLPVHISSNFAVINNRRGIWTSDKATSQTGREVAWNITLMQGVIPRAYHTLLIALKGMNIQGYIFHGLWPQKTKLLNQNPWKYMVSQLYVLISSDQLFYSEYLKQWLHCNQSRFLAPGILCQSSEQSSTPQCVTRVVKYLNLPIVELPITFHSYFNLKEVTIDEPAFTKIFFQNLKSLESILSTRSEVIQYMLEVYAAEYDNETERSYLLDVYFKNYASIPCTPDGKVLRKCTEVVDRDADFAPLYDKSESCFPIDKLSERHLSGTALLELGMISEAIPYDMLVERARTIPTLYSSNKTKALKRTKLVLSSCTKVVRAAELPLTKRRNTKSRSLPYQKAISSGELSSILFLPVLPKPTGYLLPWKGDGHELMCGKDLMIVGQDRYRGSTGINPDLAGSQVAFVNENRVEDGGCGYINQDSLSVMSIRKSPSMDEAIAQLAEIQRVFESQLPTVTQKLVESIDRMCRQLYGFLDKQLEPEKVHTYVPWHSKQEPSGKNQKEIQHLQIPSVWTGKRFVNKEIVGSDWSCDGPYLYKVPASLSSRKHLIESLQLKKHFCLKDIEKALKAMKSDFKDQPVDEQCQAVLHSIVTLLHHVELNPATNPTLMLPDEHYVMHNSNIMAYNDVDWAPKDPKYTYVHDTIPLILAKKLGVAPARSRILEKFLSSSSCQFQSIEFGQREELTRRIQNIIRDYPFDITILKELLQNTDDAKATKMYIILDMRTHGNQGILSQNWAKLQGPALLVWNDSVFSEKDLVGIQKLGLGSKRTDYESIGQYGIGFNVVYHLTDCPSFITGGKTMCVLDPHCKYVHEANVLYPGRRFEGLSEGFWESFPDMSSAYLQSGLENCPPELSGGSLFRFSLRHTMQHLLDSQIVARNKNGTAVGGPITSRSMLKMLQDWAPSMKEAMLFLNNVTELKFMIIPENGKTIHVMNKYCTKVADSVQKSRLQLHKAMSDFNKKKGNKSLVIRYPLTISDIRLSSGKEVSTDEKWLIQQGLGDMENEQQTWSFIETIKPRHGIGAPISLPPRPRPTTSYTQVLPTTAQSSEDNFKGKVFCFLPLPVTSKLPVHVNGNFILNSTRRNLWSSTEEEREDDRSVWNNRLLQAISSSYAILLEHSQSLYVSTEPYKGWLTVNHDIRKYYEIFPCSFELDKVFKIFAESVYEKLVSHNKNIMAVVNPASISPLSTSSRSESKQLQVIWYPPKSSDPSTQVYFWSYVAGSDDKWREIKTILENIGMKLTAASSSIQAHLNKVMKEGTKKIESTNPQTVFEYYSNNCSQASNTRQFPCAISNTVFRDVSRFRMFTEYLLQDTTTANASRTPSSSIKASPGSTDLLVFSSEPFGHPLLLTADGQLRRFQQEAKVIKSTFSQLFPLAPGYFVHPKMVEVAYSHGYFIVCQSLLNNSYSLALVDKLLFHHLPKCMKTNRVLQLPPKLSKDQLCNYWKCFSSDSVFSFHMPTLLKQWALLPSTRGSLHSYSDSLVPVYPVTKHETEASSLILKVYQVLQKAGMPILDIEVVYFAELSCPVISNVCDILKAMFYLNQEKDLSVIIGKNICTMVSYLKQIDFRNDPESLKYVKSLPLFECVDGEFRALHGKSAYVWPFEASGVGYSEWSKRVPKDIFVVQGGLWTCLGSPETLLITVLSVEELYSKFIFKNFHVLDERSRYSHLAHIRDELFDIISASASNKSKHNKNRERAVTFISDLKRLDCIGEDVLKPVSSYCNHEVEIFNTFSEYFDFLPAYFKSAWKEWLKFFIELGLKCTVTTYQFLLFCNNTANGKQKKPVQASSVLLKYLFSDIAKEAQWHQTSSFLEQVAKIPFVPTLPLPAFTWIRPAQCGSKTIMIDGQRYSLAQLNEVATSNCAVLLWTVKPIVTFPAHWMPFYVTEHAQLANMLGITYEADSTDVISNIRNICSSTRFTNIQHFDQYPVNNKPPSETSESLMSVMVEHVKFLHRKHSLKKLDEDAVRLLSHTPFIPVYSTFEETHHWQVILVEPRRVLHSGVNKAYHPFLHKLNKQMSGCIHLLQDLGVGSSVSLHHIQLVLQMAFERSSGQPLEPKTRECVIAALKKLIELLSSTSFSSSDKVHVDEVLLPLYLPNQDNKLALSTTLLYVDNVKFKGKLRPKLDKTLYSLLQIRVPNKGILMFESDFCTLLPSKVRPLGLSTLCSQTVLLECRATEHGDVGTVLKETISMIPNLPNAIAACVTHYEASTSLERTTTIASEFLSNLEIITLNHLRIAICFKETVPKQKLGNLDTFFFLEVAEETFSGCLYLDSKLKKSSHCFSSIPKAIASRLLRLIRLRLEQPSALTSDAYDNLLNVLCKLLNVHNQGEIREILDYHGIPLTGEGMEEATFKVGKEVPECWHHRLDQTVENVFHPGELVGYEVMEDHIIFAQIMHPILLNGYDSFDSIPPVNMRYVILTDSDNEEGVEVGVLELYKFLTSLKTDKPKPAEGENRIEVYEGESEIVQLQQELRRENVQQIILDLQRQLSDIWKLPEEDRKRAIRRLCLKWHPDKNLDNPVLAEDIFKFLNSEISRRNASNDVDWDDLERTARRQRESYKQEQDTSRPRGGFGNTSWGGGSASMPKFEEENLRPERNPAEGRRWFKQAEANFMSLVALFTEAINEKKLCADVCFMAHQVAEKALKGGKYFVCGLSDNSMKSHNISTHAYGLQSERPGETHGLANHTTPLESYYLNPRYPNRWSSGIVPADMYNYEQAKQAKDHAEAILRIIKNIVESI